jgi:ADP-ribosylglycohydrolase
MTSFQLSLMQERARAALQNLFIADALAMPVHWYYRVGDIFAAFPNGVSAFDAPPEWHPSSIMSLHSTAQGGRKAVAKAAPDVVGDVILKGRRQHWDRANVHYHVGMAAGDNTLNAHCARLLMRTLAEAEQSRGDAEGVGSGAENAGKTQGIAYSVDDFAARYVDFMTADAPQHPDTYAESYHRGFFHNYAQGLPPRKCGAVTHDTASVGGLVTIAPLALQSLLNGLSLEQVQAQCREHLFLTHPSDELALICDAYVSLVAQLLLRPDGDQPTNEQLLQSVPARTRKALLDVIEKQAPDSDVVGRMLSPACYISDSWPALLYFLCRYRDQPQQALLANTNVGGDNVHRGAVLGVLLGLLRGQSEQVWFSHLVDANAIDQEILQLVATN